MKPNKQQRLKALTGLVLARDEKCTVNACKNKSVRLYMIDKQQKLDYDNVCGVCDRCYNSLLNKKNFNSLVEVKNFEPKEQVLYNGLRWQQWVYGGYKNPFNDAKWLEKRAEERRKERKCR